jgi:glycosyltransferase involved in cell wall biosynthesis
VDDGSHINLKDKLDLKKYNIPITLLRNKYNLGQSKSIEIGLKKSSGEIIGLIDADCQNPPAELKKLYDFYNSNNFDAVISYRKNRKDESLRKTISKLANLILKIFTKSKFKDLGSSLKVIKREGLESISFKGDMHRFISPMLQARGFSIAELEVVHAERTKGVSKYGFGRIVPVIVDGILFYLTQGFTRPAKYAIGKLSFSLFIISIFLNLIVIYQKVINSVFVHRNPIFIISMVFLLLSIQVFSQIIKIDES